MDAGALDQYAKGTVAQVQSIQSLQISGDSGERRKRSQSLDR